MKFIITGALGHIGSKLIRELGNSYPKSNIIMIDNLMTQRYCSLFNLPNTATYKFIEDDILNLDLPEIFKGSNAIFQLAAITNAAGSFEQKEQVEYNNFNTTEKIAEACCITNSPLIHLSSTSVYGTQKDIVDESCSDDELQPQSPYANTKLSEEKLLKALCKTDNLRFVTCRFGTIFGISPGMRFHTAVNKFCWQAAMGKPITVWETAYEQKRPYLDLDDAVKALMFIVERKLFDGEIYNILTHNLTVKDIIESIGNNITNINIEFVKAEIMNQLSYNVSNNKFCDLGFEFRGNLDKAINNTIDLLKNSNSIK
ncbi:MAG TPA: SDR family oxidoreductase [Victivallales bacterium]|nr:SDR family oxidoreductase [Victivallales bacterium]